MAQMKFTQCGCGNQVSHDSKRCPKCGGKVSHPTSGFVKVLVGFCGFLVLITIISSWSAANHPSSLSLPGASAGPVDPEMDFLFKTVEFESTIKENLRDPGSYQRIDSKLGKDGSVCVEFRSKNGFGGMNVARALLEQPANTYSLSEKSDPAQFRKDWIKHCK